MRTVNSQSSFEPTSVMHHKPHAPEHMVRIYDMGDVHVVCNECGMHDWGDWGADDSQYTVENFKAKYGDRVLSVETFDSAMVEVWICKRCDSANDMGAYTADQLTPVRSDGTQGHVLIGETGELVGECPGPVDGPVKGF